MMTRRPLAGLVVLVALLALLVWWWLDLRLGEPTPFTPPPRVDGVRVEVDYVGSACQDGSRLVADEEDDRVVLTVRTWEYPTGCDDVGVPYRVATTLDRPVGDRELVDGACLEEPWASRPACERQAP